MVCTVLFNQPILISLRQIANVKAARRFSTIFTKLMVTVFVKSFLLFGFWKNCWKYLYQGLAQGDFKIPFFIWKSFNAIRIPYMGKYEKTRKNKTPGKASINNCLWCFFIFFLSTKFLIPFLQKQNLSEIER